MNTFTFEIRTKFGWWTPVGEVQEMRQWLINNIGEPEVDWIFAYNQPPDQNSMYVRFKNEQDAAWFVLSAL